MSARLAIAWAATLAVSAMAGWVARGPADAATSSPSAHRLATRPATPVAPSREAPAAPLGGGGALIAVSSDGQVTLRVEQQPLEWVLEQIAQQTGRADLTAARIRPAASAPAFDGGEAPEPAACPEPFVPVDPERLLLTIEHGAETERVDALLRARADGLKVPEHVLRTLVETAASERVRVAALDSWLEQRAGDPKAERAALEAALLVPSEAVQQEARQRLDDLDEMERLDALAAQGGSSP